MVASWGGSDDWSRKERTADAAPPDRRGDIPAERWAELAARHQPRRARHVGRESYQTVAGRLAALEVAHESLAERHAALVAAHDRTLADRAALAEERDAWRYRCAEAERRADRAEAELDEDARSRLGALCGGALATLFCLGSWWGVAHLIAAVVRHVTH